MTPQAYYLPLILAEAARQGLDPDVIEAVVWQESNYHAAAYRYEPAFWRRYLATNATYADELPERVSASYGLMQIMLPVGREHGFIGAPEELCVPEVNLHYGCLHFGGLLDWAAGDVESALAAYNGGKSSNRYPPRRTQAYADQVLQKCDTIRHKRLPPPGVVIV